MARYGGVSGVGKTVETGEITDATILNADISDSAAIAYTKLAADPVICRVKTGTYTGDGATAQGITGVGFQPKMVIIMTADTSDANAQHVFKFASQAAAMAADASVYSASNVRSENDMINSLDADGFTVDDGGVDRRPNQNTVAYCYIAFG